MADPESSLSKIPPEFARPWVVTAAWLYQHLGQPDVVIADCRFSLTDPQAGQQHYAASHIPGAYYFDLNRDLSGPVGRHGGRHPLPEATLLAQKLGAAGIHSGVDAPWVIAYDDTRLAFAARFWWLLRYLGYERVAVLDGGFRGWQEAGYPVSDAIPAVRSASFMPQPRLDWVVDIETVKARKDQPNTVLIDSREAERYRGEREPIDPVAGHIPGAVNCPWQEVTDTQGYVRPLAEQQQRWNWVPPATELLVYCGSGVTACVNLLSLELAGLPTGKLYAGSWSDWCSYL
ncbi:MAG: sulfurtransferase [Synechococcales cyanobacterium M58_A2018_015]|nr:sulfurtransferase [Synechococcales cyanobacterium M58_A2018_015]